MYGDERRVATEVDYSKAGGYFVRLDLTLSTDGECLRLTASEARALATRLVAAADEADRAGRTVACL